MFLRSTETGAGVLGRGVRKFAAICEEKDIDIVGFHVAEDNNDEWTIVPEREDDFRRLPAGDKMTIRGHLRWWRGIDWVAGPCRIVGPGCMSTNRLGIFLGGNS